MHIYDDDKEVEMVRLFDLKAKEEMRALFEEKGFHKMGQKEKIDQFRLRQAEKDIARLESSPFDNMMTIYVSLAAFAAISLCFLRNRSSRRSRNTARTAQVLTA